MNGPHSRTSTLPDGVRWLVLAAGFVGGLVGGLYSSDPWLRVALLALAAGIGVAVLVEAVTRILAALVEQQRWKYRLADVTQQTVMVPNDTVKGDKVKRLFGHPDVDSKASGALRKLIRWWHAPCSDCHPELMERNEIYQELRPVTARVLAMHTDELRQLVRTHVDEAVRRQQAEFADWSITKLRVLLGPIAMSMVYELVFRRRCPEKALPSLVASVVDVIAATGALRGRNMAPRLEALAHVRRVLEEDGGRPDLFGEDCTLTLDQRAKYLQGVWIHTATAQILRLGCNTIANVARHPRCLERLRQEMARPGPYIEAVLLETLRVAPGTPSTNRVASRDVDLGDGVVVPRGTNVVFNFDKYHRADIDSPDEFVPERWLGVDHRQANFMPFGVGKRRCPAERFSFVVAQELVLGLLASLHFCLPAGRGLLFSKKPQVANDLCCVIRRPSLGPVGLWAVRAWLGGALMVENWRRSATQLRTMPRNARAAFEEADAAEGGGGRCPVSKRSAPPAAGETATSTPP